MKPHIGAESSARDLRPARRAMRRRTAIFAALAVGFAGLATPVPTAIAATPAWQTSFEAGEPTLDGTALTDVPANFTGTLSGIVAVTADPSAQTNPGGESVDKISDGNQSTKWFAGYQPSAGSPLAAIYEYGQPTSFTSYTVTSADDEPNRDPRDWTISGSNDGGSWNVLATESGQSFSERHQTKTYAVAAGANYRYFKFSITANNGASGTQLADWIPAVAPVAEEPGNLRLAVSSGPTGGWTQKSGAGFTGLKSAHYWGKHTATGPVKSTVRLQSGLNIAVDGQTQLSYKVYPILNSGWEFSATYVAVDVKFSDGTWMSADADLRDVYGFHATARAQGDEKALFANQWNSVRIPLGGFAGKTVTEVAFTYDNDTAVTGTIAQGYLDDIAIEAVAPIDGSSLLNYVETRRGTNSNGGFSRGTFVPATAVPNGFNLWTPFTNADSNTPYEYHRANDGQNLTRLQGVGITHLTSNWMGDSNRLVFMPSTSGTTTEAGFSERALPFSHDDEIARPNYYSVELRDRDNSATTNGLRVEVAPTNHGSVLQFTYPGSQSTGTLFVDAGTSNDGDLTVSGDELTGWVQGNRRGGSGAGSTRMYVYGKFDRAATASGDASNAHKAEFARFDVSSSKTVVLRVATSFISGAQAQKNLELEVGNKSLTQVVDDTTALWEDRLGVIDLSQATTATDADKVTMYSNLFKFNLFPSTRWENTGSAEVPTYKYASAVGCDVAIGCSTSEHTDQNVPVMAGKNYVNTGFWDTYRTSWPLYTFLYPEFAAELAEGFLKQYDDGGWVSRWSSPGYSDIMTGTSSDISFADVYISSDAMSVANAEHAYKAAVKNATVFSPNRAVGRKGIERSIFLGFTQASEHESVSWGLEGMINDAGIAEMALKLSQEQSLSQPKRDRYAEEAEYYFDRAKNYINMFNPTFEFFTTRNADGVFPQTSFNPKAWWGPYTETNGWNFAFHAPYDPNGLAGLYGDTTAGIKEKLDEFYATPEQTNGSIHEELEASSVRMGQLGMSNQVSHHIPYISAATGDPARTQEVVRESLQRLWVGSDIGQGYLGDEDNGEMSAWYIFSSLGFYPLALASGEYAIGSPLHDKVIVNRAASQGDTLTINAPENSYDHVYVDGVKVGNKELAEPTLLVEDLRNADTLEFTMSDEPSDWAVDLDRPVSAPVPLDDLTKPTYSSTSQTGITNVGNLVDDTSETSATFTAGAEFIVSANASVGEVPVKTYTLTSAASAAAPSSWTLAGSNDGETWTTVDSRSGVTFEHNRQTVPFQVPNPQRYSQYRLTLENGTALSQVELLVDPAGGADGEELEVIIETDLTARAGVAVSDAVASVTGPLAGGTATVDFGDGTGPQAATISHGGLGGATVIASHTYDNAGVYPVTVAVTSAGEIKSAAGEIIVKRDVRFEAGFDMACLTNVGTPANCDGNGYAYDKASMATAREGFPALVQGTEHAVPGHPDMKFTLPVIADGEFDNMTGQGLSKVRVYLGDDATKVSFIGTANERDLSHSVTLTYEDGHQQTIPVGYNNWDSTSGTDNIVVGASTGRTNSSGALVNDNLRPKIWATQPTNLATGHGEVVWLSMTPASNDKAQIHLFAVATDGNRQPTAPIEIAPASDLTLHAGATVPAQIATIAGGESSTNKTATINWGDGSAATSVAVGADGSVVAIPPYTAPGTYTVIVTIDDEVTDASQSFTVTVVEPVNAGLSLSAAPTTVAAGGSTTLSASLAAGATGSVEFFSSDESLGSVSVTGGKAQKVVSNLAAGVYTYTAVYSGDGVYGSATSNAVTVNVTADQAPAAAVSAPRFSKAKQPFNAKGKKRASVAVTVANATSGRVTFKVGSRVLGTANVVRSGSAYTATLQVPAKLPVGSYRGVTATWVSGGKTVVSPAGAQQFRVVKARPKKVTVKTKRVRAGVRAKVKIKVAKLNNGRHAAGRVQIRVGKKVVGVKKFKAKAKGNVTVRLQRSFGSNVKVRAKFVPKNKKNLRAKQSKVTTIKVRR
ncbi:alpha-1,2-mannosidase, putative [Micrococcales bacterium KH10]|nr:alpha-1,2-mannosidase, putative [Micrococcales bacterium KH10]